MKALTLKATQTRINSAIAANDESNLQDLFVNTIYHGLIHGNIMPKAMAALRDSKVSSKFKAGVSKHMPMTWNKKKGVYEYSRARADKLLASLELERNESTLESVAAALPELFKSEKQTKVYDRADYLATVARKLEKEGEQDAELVIGIAAALLANPELISAASAAIFTESTEEKAA